MTLGGLDASQAGATHGLDGGLADVKVQIPEENFNKVYLKTLPWRHGHLSLSK